MFSLSRQHLNRQQQSCQCANIKRRAKIIPDRWDWLCHVPFNSLSFPFPKSYLAQGHQKYLRVGGLIKRVMGLVPPLAKVKSEQKARGPSFTHMTSWRMVPFPSHWTNRWRTWEKGLSESKPFRVRLEPGFVVRCHRSCNNSELRVYDRISLYKQLISCLDGVDRKQMQYTNQVPDNCGTSGTKPSAVGSKRAASGNEVYQVLHSWYLTRIVDVQEQDTIETIQPLSHLSS